MYKIAVILGDGIGPEVVNATLEILKNMNLGIKFVIREAGYECWKKYGKQITDTTIETIKDSNACLKGPTLTPPGPETFRSVAVTLRQTLDLYANVRPIKTRKGVKSLFQNVDFIIVRENTEGLYVGIEERKPDRALATRVITRKGSERIAKFAFDLAVSEKRKKVTIVHKANIMKETCGLFRDVSLEVAKRYPNIQVDELLIDAAAHRIVTRPSELDIIVTTNLFGDILSDEAAGIAGGLGLAPGANIGEKYAMFEPIHGVALKYAGKGIADPSATILSAVMMLKHIGEKEAAIKLENALNTVIAKGQNVTRDLGGEATTFEMAKEIVKTLNTL